MAYKPRLSAPSKSNRYYYDLNPFYQCGFGLPNCTCHAWGRRYEVTGKKPKLSTANAENWWGHNDGYPRGRTPKLSAVICWRKGKAGNGADGAGHVAYVEEVYPNGDIRTSNSAWGGTRFYTQYLTAASGYDIGGGFVFQGFIYDPDTEEETVSVPEYRAGKTYTLQSNLKVRKGPGKSYAHIKRSRLTEAERKKAQKGTYAVIKSGRKVKAEKVKKKAGGKYVWIRIPSGWVCAKEGDEIYMR